MKINSKLPDIGTTIFTIMSKMAQEHDAINLSQGFPDFSVPQALMDLLNKYTQEGYNQYPPMTGIPYLREQIAKKTMQLYACEVCPETEITITSGATEALYVAIQTLVSSGDEVIVLDPAYDAYDPAVRLAGGSVIHVPLQVPDFSVDWDRVKQAVSSKTRLIILNTPHNPCGAVFSADDLDELALIVNSHDVWLLSDEVYEHMIYDGLSHQSMLRLEALRNRSFVVSSFGKTYHATGWKVGYCIAPPLLSAEFRKIHQFVTFTTHTPSQWALAEFMEKYPEHHLELANFYQGKRDTFLELMKDSPFKMKPSMGTYFQLADYSEISSEIDTSFVESLTKDLGVAAIPVSVFYDKPPSDATLIRFCFAKDDATLALAAEKLKRIEGRR